MSLLGVDLGPVAQSTTATNWALHNTLSNYSAPSTNQTALKDLNTGTDSSIYWRQISQSGGSVSSTTAGRNTTVGDFPSTVRAQSHQAAAGVTIVYNLYGGTSGELANLQFAFARGVTATDRNASVTVTNNSGYSQNATADACVDTTSSIASFENVPFGTDNKIVLTVTNVSGSSFFYPTAVILEYPLTPDLSIESVTGTLTFGEQLTATVTGGGSDGTVTVTQGAVNEVLSNVSWGSTSIVAEFAEISDSHLYPGSASVEILNTSYKSDTSSITITSPDGYSIVTIVSVAGSGTIPVDTPLATGDKVLFNNYLWQSGVETEYTFSVNEDGTSTVDPDVDDGDYTAKYRVWDATDASWGTEGTVTVTLGTVTSSTGGIIREIVVGMVAPFAYKM